jgi:signal transduction histidine kinase
MPKPETEKTSNVMNDNRDRTYLQTPEQWTHFLSAFVHEIRTPLASFRMLADLLAEAPQGHLGPQERRYSESMREVAQDLQALIGEVAELAQLLAGRITVKPVEVPLEQLVDQVEEAARPRAWEQGVTLTDFLAFDLPKSFRTDPALLRQAFVLLLEAAVSHAKSEVFFRLEITGGDLQVVISSDGPPFAEAALPSLFDPFQRDVRTVRSRGGRSLALPLAQELARALGGTLDAENREGRPTIAFSIPAAGA